MNHRKSRKKPRPAGNKKRLIVLLIMGIIAVACLVGLALRYYLHFKNHT